MGSIKHAKTSPVPNPLGDTRRVGGGDWNSEHIIDLNVSDIDGLEARLIPVEQVEQFRDDALAFRNEAAASASDAADSAAEAAATVGALAAPGGAELVGTPEGTVQEALDGRVKQDALSTPATIPAYAFSAAEAQSIFDNALPMQNYGALRTYAGRASGVRITTPGLAGVFQRDASDITSLDNGGTILVDALGRRWKRIFSGFAFVGWFGAAGNGVADDTAAFLSAIASNIKLIYAPDVYKITATLGLATGQVIEGMNRSVSKLLWRPTSDVVCIKNATGTNYNGIRKLTIDGNDNTKYAVQFATSYSNIVKDCAFKGTFDIGLLMHDNYVAQIDDLDTTGSSFKRFIVAISLNSNAHTINKLHTSGFPNDVATPLVGIALEGGKGHVLRDCILQGQTIGIYLANPLATSIESPYFENTLCNIKSGDNTRVGNSNATIITSGHFSAPYNTHPQYASRGPIVYAPRSDLLTLRSCAFNETANAASATGPWPILTTSTTLRIALDNVFHFGGTTREMLLKDVAGASPSLSIMGARYGANSAQEVILKCDGSFAGNSFGIRVDNAGVVSTNAYTPSVIAGPVASLLTQAMPNIASLVV